MPEDEAEYQEVTLADIVRTLHRRWMVLGAVFLLVVLGGVAFTAFSTPEYESTTTLVPLEHGDIIKNWLDSRNASALVVGSLGDPLLQELYPDRWDASTQTWKSGQAPGREESAAAVDDRTTVEYRGNDRTSSERYLALTVRLTDPALARDVADAYVATLGELRPRLEDITQQEAFEKFYDGSNEQAAQRNAETTAQQRDYWLVLDPAGTPRDPVAPNVTLNIALAVVLGLMLGVFSVFLVEWASNYRAESRRIEAPPAPVAEEPPGEEERRRARPERRPERRRYA